MLNSWFPHPKHEFALQKSQSHGNVITGKLDTACDKWEPWNITTSYIILVTKVLFISVEKPGTRDNAVLYFVVYKIKPKIMSCFDNCNYLKWVGAALIRSATKVIEILHVDVIAALSK